MSLRYFSVCSGIEAATVAWHPLGWTPVAFAENAKFPAAVLAHHYPDVPNIGDIRNALKPDCHIPAFDLLVGGTPCQSFSFAGNRGGLDDDRGQLALVFCQIARRYRPRWVVWENVPGALSAQDGEAFASITGALAELGYDLAWRVLDAQFVRVDGYPRAVPQRRRRVFLVGCLGGGTRAGVVLFDRESVHGNSPPRRGPRKASAGDPAADTILGGGDTLSGGNVLAFGGNDTRGPIDVATARSAHGGPHGRLDFESETFVCVPFDMTQVTSGVNRSKPKPGDPCHTLLARACPPTIAFHARQDPDFGDVTHPLDTDGTSIGVLHNWRVRRLTPVECERLQGFPDGYTNVPLKRGRGRVVYPKDGPRYKAIGNSMAVNAMRWIGQRIDFVHRLPSDVI